MDQTALVLAVRTRLGKLISANIVDIEDTDIIRDTNTILEKINSCMKKKVIQHIVTEANVREYDVEDETIRVQEIISASEVSELQMKLGNTIIGNEESADENYNFPSLWLIKNLRRLYAMPRMRFEFNPVERLLKIDPTPTVDGEKIYYVSVESAGWTLPKITVDFEEIVTVGTTWKCMETVAMRRSTEGGILREGGRVEYPADSLFRIAGMMKKEFEELLDIKMKLYF